MDGVHVRAPGKINVFLEVGDVQDDGYHDVATAYQAVSVFEDVFATEADDFTISVTGSVDVTGVPLDDRNLALRAARLLAARSGSHGRRAPRRAQGRAGGRRHGRRVGGCRGRPGRVRRPVGDRGIDEPAAAARGAAGGRRPLLADGRHRRGNGPRRPAERGAGARTLRLGHRDERRGDVDARGVCRPRRASRESGHRHHARLPHPRRRLGGAAGAARRRSGAARGEPAQRPAGGDASAAPGAHRRAASRRDLRRPCRDRLRARGRPSPSSPRTRTRRSTCGSR